MTPINITESQRRAYCASPVTIYRPNKAGRLVKVKTIQVAMIEPKRISYGRDIAPHTHRAGKVAKGNTTPRKVGA